MHSEAIFGKIKAIKEEGLMGSSWQETEFELIYFFVVVVVFGGFLRSFTPKQNVVMDQCEVIFTGSGRVELLDKQSFSVESISALSGLELWSTIKWFSCVFFWTTMS